MAPFKTASRGSSSIAPGYVPAAVVYFHLTVLPSELLLCTPATCVFVLVSFTHNAMRCGPRFAFGSLEAFQNLGVPLHDGY